MHKKSMLLVYAHPDDESFTMGGTIAKYATRGVDVHLICATRGEAGKTSEQCTPEELGAIREKEAREAAAVLGISSIKFLDYRDKELCKANSLEVTTQIANAIREVQPDVVITFGADGSSGHQDHKAIHHFTIASVVLAGKEGITELSGRPFKVPRLYFVAFHVKVREGLGRTQRLPEPDTVIDIAAYSAIKLDALRRHKTQLGSLHKFLALGEERLHYFLTQETFKLAEEYSSIKIPGGSDLFGEYENKLATN